MKNYVWVNTGEYVLKQFKEFKYMEVKDSGFDGNLNKYIYLSIEGLVDGSDCDGELTEDWYTIIDVQVNGDFQSADYKAKSEYFKSIFNEISKYLDQKQAIDFPKIMKNLKQKNKKTK